MRGRLRSAVFFVLFKAVRRLSLNAWKMSGPWYAHRRSCDSYTSSKRVFLCGNAVGVGQVAQGIKALLYLDLRKGDVSEGMTLTT